MDDVAFRRDGAIVHLDQVGHGHESEEGDAQGHAPEGEGTVRQAGGDGMGIFEGCQQQQVQAQGEDQHGLLLPLRPGPLDAQGQEMIGKRGAQEEQHEPAFAPGVAHQAGQEQEYVPGLLFKEQRDQQYGRQEQRTEKPVY